MLQRTNMSELHFPGLSASNMLGYLAALGLLRASTLAWPSAHFKMRWELSEGIWSPILSSGSAFDKTGFSKKLAEFLKNAGQLSALNMTDDLTLTIEEFREKQMKIVDVANQEQREDADFISALGSDVVQSTLNGKPTGQIADTAFRTMSGAGHQHFLGTMRTFITDTTPRHLEKALFETWDYGDPLEKHSMRWDPMDDIRYALRWDNPSGDRQRKSSGSMWGANRLAIEALPLFPVVSVRHKLETRGFYEPRKGRAIFSWPVWEPAIGLDCIRSLLASEELQMETPNRKSLAARGVMEIYRSERITQGKYRNFTPARPA